MPEPQLIVPVRSYDILPDDAITRLGDIVQTGNVKPSVVAASLCLSSGWHYFYEPDRNAMDCHAYAFILYGMAGTTVRQIKESTLAQAVIERPDTARMYVLRMRPPIAGSELESCTRDGRFVSDHPPSEQDFSNVTATRRWRQSPRYRMNPIYSKPHPFFGRDEPPPPEKKDAPF